MYIVYVNVKNGVWYSLMPGIDEHYSSKKFQRVDFWLTGTEESGPVSKEANVIFAASFFLLIMALLGDTRSTVLETEAQLLILYDPISSHGIVHFIL